jgi:ABC-type sulfate transport system substrate-binding protein
LERGLIYDTPAEKGTTALTKSFLEDPSRYDFITAYESAALAAAAKNPNIAVIYPSPTAVSEHAVSLLSGSWVTAEQKAGAEAFLQFLGSEEALRAGVAEKFRPVVSGSDISLAPELSRFAGQGFVQTYAPIELPPYEALNTAAYQWRIKIAKQAP